MTITINVEGLKKLSSNLIDFQLVNKLLQDFGNIQKVAMEIFNHQGNVTEMVNAKITEFELKATEVMNGISEIRTAIANYRNLQGNNGNTGDLS